MTKLQFTVVGVGIALVFILYFGFDTKSPAQQKEIQSRELAGTKIEISSIEEAAKKSLTAEHLKEIEGLQQMSDNPNLEVNEQLAIWKELSGAWYDARQYLISGHYAEQIAEANPSGETWGIAGTTYLPGIHAEDAMIAEASYAACIRALENAISLEPDSVKHRINLAIVYAEKPLPEDPMKGIQMLLRLNERNPENIVVLNTLARLAIKTGQFDKAKTRLQKALSIKPDTPLSNCLLAEVLERLQDPQADDQRRKCELLTKKE